MGVNQEEVEHCLQCHVCFEHSFWSCKSCGATTARLCQLCCPEVSCDFCEPEPEMGNDEFDGNRLIIEEEAEMAENYDQYTWKSLQSLSQLAIDDKDESGNVSTVFIFTNLSKAIIRTGPPPGD